ncbi:hypothetical protein L1887_61379 [Cichorium endivia]|nr:hypothetical protein L1887_61379 [Cichorium endivia]
MKSGRSAGQGKGPDGASINRRSSSSHCPAIGFWASYFQRRTITKGKQPPDIDLPATSNSHSPSADSDTESSSLGERRRSSPFDSGGLPPLRLMRTRFSRRERIKGESHASVCGSRSHTLIPTGARSRPAALPKPIIISVPRPHCWKGSASKPYVELPPHTAPLGMELAERHTGKEFIAPLGTSHPRTAWTMSPEQSQYIWRKTIPHIEVRNGSGVFTSHRSARFVLISD